MIIHSLWGCSPGWAFFGRITIGLDQWETPHEIIPAFSSISNSSFINFICFSGICVYFLCNRRMISCINTILSSIMWPISSWYGENISIYSSNNFFKACWVSRFYRVWSRLIFLCVLTFVGEHTNLALGRVQGKVVSDCFTF